MRILVVGSTGVLGRQVIPRLLERGHVARALVRNEVQATVWRRLGAEAVLGDIFDAAGLAHSADGCEATLHLATSIPRYGQPQDYATNDRIRREGTRNLLDAATNAGLQRYVQQSITFIYGDRGTELVDETTPINPPPLARSAADMEALVQAADLEWCILRGGWFYGPGTERREEWWRAAHDGTLQLPGDGTPMTSLIHVVDFARALVTAVERAPGGSTYNLVDDYPVSYRELYGYIAAQAGAFSPTAGGESFFPSLNCSNELIRTELGWQPAFPTYRSGLA